MPAELTRAALRRAWVSDPAIRDFIGIAENQWDFNDPEAIPGFVSLPERIRRVRPSVARLGGRERLANGEFRKYRLLHQQPPLTVTARQAADPGLDVRQAPDDGPRHLPEDGSGERAVSRK